MKSKPSTVVAVLVILSLMTAAGAWAQTPGTIDDLTPALPETKPDPALRVPVAYERPVPGPDGFGYTYSTSPTQVTALGDDALVLDLAGDDEAVQISIPFEFLFYGHSYQQLWVSSNGFLAVDMPRPGETWANRAPPDPAFDGGLIAPFWDDLVIDSMAGDQVRVQARADRLIVEWIAHSYRHPEAAYRFQAVLHPSGNVDFHYLAVDGPTAGTTVGIQASGAKAGLGYLFNGFPEANPLQAGLAVRFAYPSGLYLSPGYQRATGQAGERLSLTVALINQTGTAGSFALQAQDGALLTVEPAETDLPAGASVPVQLEFRVPQAAPGSQHTLRLLAQQVDGPATARAELGILVNSGLYGYTGASTTDEAAIWDLATSLLLDRLDLLPEGNYPYDATMTPDGAEVWIPGASGDGVVVIDTSTNAISHRISVGEYPINVTFRADGAYAFVSNRDTDDITVVDTATYAAVDSIPVPTQYLGPGNMALNPASGDIYVVDWYDNRFWVLDPVNMSLIEEIPLGNSLWQLVVSPSGDLLYVTDRGSDTVHVLDTGTLAEVGTIPTGDDPWGIDVTPDGTLLYITNEDSHDVTVADAQTYGVITTIDLPQTDDDPRDVDFAEDGSLAYVPSGAISGVGDRIYVIDTTNHGVLDQVDISPAANPNVVAVAPQMAGVAYLMHVHDITLRYRARTWPPEDLLFKVWARVRIVDAAGQPVEGAEVFVEWERPDGALRLRSQPTNSAGHAFLRTVSRQTGTYTATVIDVVKADWTYDPDANEETSDQISVP